MWKGIYWQAIPRIQDWASLDSVICYPAKTLYEYLYIYWSSLLIDWKKEEESMLESYQRKLILIETLSDNEIRDIIFYKKRYKEDASVFINELAKRSWKKMKFDPEEDRRKLNEQKMNVSIVTVMQSYTDMKRYRRWNLIKCPMPDHKDSTASLSINERTWAWKCFWCNKWWGQVDFIMHMEWCSLKDAITKFLQY